MNQRIEILKKKILNGGQIEKEEALSLCEVPVEELTAAANELRQHFCGAQFDMCTIINGKCGRCSEDCKFCAQSSHYETSCHETYPLLPAEEMVAEAKRNADRGVLRFSIVTSGKRLSDREVDEVCNSIREIRENAGIEVCLSFGLLSEEQFRKIKEAGASRVHCNLETSQRFFSKVCTTHTFEEKVETLKAAQRAGLEVCSGGIMGLGESMEDRIDMVLTARELGVKSIPVNVLNPIPGTPFANNRILSNDEICQIIGIFRFLIPDGFIRLAGGRGLFADKGRRSFTSGANAAITGEMLTTAGITVESDQKLLDELGYQIRLCE